MQQDFPDGPPVPAEHASRPEPAGAPGATDRRLDAATRRRIGQSLRILYAGLLTQPIPERFETLIAAFAVRSGEESER